MHIVEGLLECHQLPPRLDPILLVLVKGDLLWNILEGVHRLVKVPLQVLRAGVVGRFPHEGLRLINSGSLVT